MILTLLEAERLYIIRLPKKANGKYSLDHINAMGMPETVLTAEGISGKWVLSTTAYAGFADGSKQTEAADGIYELSLSRTMMNALLIVETEEEPHISFFGKQLRKPCEFSVGGRKGDSLSYDPEHFPLLKNTFVKISCSDNGFTLTDLAGKVYIDEKAAHTGPLKAGTQLYIGGVKAVIGRNVISCNNKAYISRIDENTFTDPDVVRIRQKESHEIAGGTTDDLFYCSPRFIDNDEKAVIKIEQPPSSVISEPYPAIFSIGPSLTMGMASVATAGFSVAGNISRGGEFKDIAPTVIMAGSMVLGSVMWPLISKSAEKRRSRKKERNRTRSYSEYIKTVRNKMADISAEQTERLRKDNPEIKVLLKRVENRERELWERVKGQKDFLSFVAGTGDIPADIDIDFKAKEFEAEKDPLYDLAADTASDKLILKNVPVSVSLETDHILGIVGSQDDTEAYIRDMLFQISALHSYEAVRFVLIISEESRRRWDYIRWLPHFSSPEGEIRYIASTTEDMKLISADLEKRFSDNANCEYIIFSFDRILAAKTGLISRILSSGKRKNFSFVAVYNEVKYLPKECLRIITAESEKIIIRSLDSESMTLQPIEHITAEDLKKASISMANTHLAKSDRSYELPDMLTFMDLMGSSRCEHLNCAQRWKDNNPVNSIKAPIGIDENGDICYLDLHQNAHGPHGLVAGMTGSGKSEFIMTYILSMALNYSPAEVSFILIDYKGGGMSKAFEKLPHIAGMITNLDGSGISRALVSIESELKRRELVFGRTSEKLEVSNLDIYKYQKLYRSGAVSEPMSHLFIISDEFAELKSQQPEFMEKLISTARIGRSLGVHLILATQKPSGVVSDQIWSNSRFKICLKVQDASDSTEMIKCPDAAAITKTGRFYLQVGYNEMFVMGQSAWCGAVYRPEEKSHISADTEITVIDRCGRRIAQASSLNLIKQTSDSKGISCKQLDAVLEYIRKTAAAEGVSARPMWLPVLPDNLYIDSIGDMYPSSDFGYYHSAEIAVYDAPEKQEQKILSVSPLDEGNIVIYGAAGSGKVSFINSMICSFAKKYSPEEVNMYIIDFGTETLIQMKNIPHIGEIILPSDGSRIRDLFAFIKKQADIRKKLFLEHGGDYKTYCDVKKKLPEIIIIINNYSGFSEYAGQLFDTSLLSLGKLGISFVVTANLVNALGFSVLQNFKQKLTMQLNEDTYSLVLGNTGRMLPQHRKGSGLVRIDNKVYEFQTAFIADRENQAEYIAELTDALCEKYPDKTAARIPRLPDRYTCRNVPSAAVSKLKLKKLPVGLSAVGASPVYFDFSNDFTVISHKAVFDNNVVQGMAELLSMYYHDRLSVLDPFEIFSAGRKDYTYIHGKKEVSEYIDTAFDEALFRHNNYNDAVRNSQEPPVYEEKAIFFCGINRLMNSLDAVTKEKLVNMFDKVGSRHGLRYIIYEKFNELYTLSSVASFSERRNTNSFIWVGAGYNEQNVFTYIKTNEKTDELENSGFVVSGKKLSFVRLICSEEVKEQDNE